ncbi:His-Xaa-Ser system protein HxsD [Flavobacterium sp. xlx-214]|uniref:His-Xaa-Ser system protein HxsD n=1 Tax=unclassified Flavobacterium TaxID=196869 RepID=UPI0013D466C0|nr:MULTISPECIES: His-Xaa-Ser system protein HxsD [unclassified Flavobacterium]MBA5792701.1 His-Xaa-Ser system protein HxsD [Flavobacterium sp. xlx-221]QMI83846.1 His-Xaa-Ser system protein HxsD [Flavobacterium sp. xlx-214]
MKNIAYKNGILIFKLSIQDYSESVVYKCMYWYLGNYNVEITSDFNDYTVKIALKNNTDFDEEELIVRLKNDLIDFKLREIINNETANLRELITAKAFANYDFNIMEDNNFEISDPVGFDPNDIK